MSAVAEKNSRLVARIPSAVRKTIQAAADLAEGIGLFVDAKDEATAAFYGRFGFEPTPSSPLTLFMSTETIRQFAA